MENDLSLLIVLCATYICGSQRTDTVILSPQFAEADEFTDVTLTCSYDGQFTDFGMGYFKWFLFTFETTVSNANCYVPPPWLNNRNMYTYRCINYTSHSVTLVNITQQRHGETWRCGAGINERSFLSNNVTILVTVPVKAVTISPLTNILTKAENEMLELLCTSSPCRPTPKFRWYLSNGDKPAIILSESAPTESRSGAIQSYTNRQSIAVNRTWNERSVFCGAQARNEGFLLSPKIFINVTYPPDGPPVIEMFENGSEIKILKDGFVNLKCSITGGNPLPRLEWNKNNYMPQIVDGGTVTRNITWQAIDKKKDELKCEAIQSDLKYTTFLSLNVLYPPETPTITLETFSGAYVHVYKTLNVIEGRPFSLNCSADSNPPVSLFQWNNLPPSISSVYNVANTDRHTLKNIACKVSNTMQTSDSNTPRTGSNITYLEVNVLYPPTMNIAREATIIEGDNHDTLCIFIPGNPSDTNMTWSWKGRTWNVNPQQPYIVSRNQSGVYRCSVRNLMVLSDGTRVFGNASGEFNLSVQYKTSVLRFVINEQNDKVNITINENSTVNLTCEVEGLPLPTGQLLHQSFQNQKAMELPRTFTRLSQTSTNFRLTSSFPAQCTDSGIHTCSGANTLYNGWQSVSNKSLALFVTCKPRMSPFIQILDTVSSLTLVDVTLSFTALAYPVPSESGYVWSRQGQTSDVWVNISLGGNKTNISTRGLQSNLTIKDISQFDYGMYRLFIFNDVGQYNHTFTLVPAGYSNDGSSITSSNASVVAASVAGTVVGVVVAVIIIMVYRKRKSLSYQKKESSVEYYNVSDSKVAELNIARQVDNANAYEAFQSTGSDQQYDSLSQYDCIEKNDSDSNMSANNRSLNVYEGLRNTGFDQQYEQISPIASHSEKGQPMVYENLQLTRNSQNSHDAN